MGDNWTVLANGIYGRIIANQPTSRVFLWNGAVGFSAFDGNFTFPTSNTGYDYQTVGHPEHTVIFLPNGNFGIGTTSPAYTLDVAGSTHVNTDLTVTGNSNVSGNSAVSGSLQVNKAILPNGQSGAQGDFLVSSGSPNQAPTWGNPHSLIGDYGWLLDGSNSGTNMVLGLNDGNPLVLQPPLSGSLHAGPVLIGTRTVPQADNGFNIPSVNNAFMLEVKGGILAKEFVVFTHWSDFVFEKDYQLTPLPELESKIATLKHLPGIPSEQEVVESGAHLGEVTSKLLQKIEELTLYVIDLNKQNEQLKARVKTLEDHSE